MELGRTRSRIADAFFAVVTLSIVLPATLSAQLGSTFDLEDRQAAVGRVPIGKIIRLRLSDGGRAAGPVRRWNSLAVVLGPYMGYAAQDTFVSIRAIDTLWLRGNAKQRGAIYGGISGLSLGLVIGVTSGSLCPRAGWIRPCTQGALRSGAVGLLAGGPRSRDEGFDLAVLERDDIAGRIEGRAVHSVLDWLGWMTAAWCRGVGVPAARHPASPPPQAPPPSGPPPAGRPGTRTAANVGCLVQTVKGP